MSLATKFGAGNAAELTAPSRNDFSRAGEGTIAPRALSYHFGSGFVSLTAPTLTWDTASSDNTPQFTVTFVSTPAVSDTVEFQIDDDPAFGSTSDTSDTVDAGEVTANDVVLTLAALADGTYSARARHVRGATVSDWSDPVTVTIAAAGASDRDLIIQAIWTGEGLPVDGADTVTTGVADPLTVDASNTSRVDQYDFILKDNTGTTFETVSAWHWRPTTRVNKLVIFHTGHGHSFESGNNNAAIREMVAGGYDVIGIHMIANDGGTGVHDKPAPTATLNYMRYFVEPTVRAINQVEAEAFASIHMTGLSGGGWATQMIPAVDGRIDSSFALAGTYPMNITDGGTGGTRDFEQLLPGIYPDYDYPDLGLLAATNGRAWWIGNDQDPSNFAKTWYDAADPADQFGPALVADAVAAGGEFYLAWITHNVHEWTRATRLLMLDFMGGSGFEAIRGVTNACADPKDFSAATHTKNSTTVTVNTGLTTAPDGTSTADILVEAAATALHSVQNTTSFGLSTVGVQRWCSVFAKAKDRSVIQMLGNSSAYGSGAYVNFDLAAGAVGSKGTNASGFIIPAGDGWYKCIAVFKATGSDTSFVHIVMQTSSSAARAASYAGNGTSGVYLWGREDYV